MWIWINAFCACSGPSCRRYSHTPALIQGHAPSFTHPTPFWACALSSHIPLCFFMAKPNLLRPCPSAPQGYIFPNWDTPLLPVYYASLFQTNPPHSALVLPQLPRQRCFHSLWDASYILLPSYCGLPGSPELSCGHTHASWTLLSVLHHKHETRLLQPTTPLP